jgi:hypothetical protein
MGMTAFRARERRAAHLATLPRPVSPTRQLTDAERIDRLREENRGLRDEIATLKERIAELLIAGNSEPQVEPVSTEPAKVEAQQVQNRNQNGKRRG